MEAAALVASTAVVVIGMATALVARHRLDLADRGGTRLSDRRRVLVVRNVGVALFMIGLIVGGGVLAVTTK